MIIRSVRVQNWKCFADTGVLDLGRVSVIVGGNNSGKSAILKAIHLMQNGADAWSSDVRIGEASGQFDALLVAESPQDFGRFNRALDINSAPLRIQFSRQGQPNLAVTPTMEVGQGVWSNVDLVQSSEPESYIYPYFSKRKTIIDNNVDRQRTISVTSDLRNLASKVFRLSDRTYVKHDEFVEVCNKLLGFDIGTYALEQGQSIGVSVGLSDNIPIQAMGEGVASLLGLITSLCVADGNLFLIEEPENDIHPAALKALLDLILKKSDRNQLIVTTHSNIVVRHLGSAPDAKIFSVTSTFNRGEAPLSTVAPVENTPEARMAVLRSLGYELSDLELYEGWLFLEESSAQTIINNYLIPWFVPRLARIRVVSARGVTNVEPVFNDFRRLFLYAHLEQQYAGRAWVMVDGDEPGEKVVSKLREDFATWPAEHFCKWSKSQFESYYPERFKQQAEQALTLSRGQKQEAKKNLLNDVRAWCDENQIEAKEAFATSAQEVIEFLNRIDEKLFGPQLT